MPDKARPLQLGCSADLPGRSYDSYLEEQESGCVAIVADMMIGRHSPVQFKCNGRSRVLWRSARHWGRLLGRHIYVYIVCFDA
jgi:hypothetical protein